MTTQCAPLIITTPITTLEPHITRAVAPLRGQVNDAFGTAHRAHGSTEGVTKFLSPSVAGFLLQKELDYLDGAVSEPKRPFAAIVGGSKVSSKIGVIESLMEKVVPRTHGSLTTHRSRGVAPLEGHATHSHSSLTHPSRMPPFAPPPSQVDKIVIGGGMVFTFLKARGLETGSSLVEEDQLELASK